MNASNFHRVSVSGGKVTRSGPKALLLLCVVSSSASATPLVDTAFTGEQSGDGSAVTGFYQYDMSTAILDSYSNSNGSVSAEYTFQGAGNFFFAKRADGSVFTGQALTVVFENNVRGTVACPDETGPFDALLFFADYADPTVRGAGGTSRFYFSVYDCSGTMFSSAVTTLPQTNIPLTIQENPTSSTGLHQFDEEGTGSLGGFRIESLTPVPEPGALGLLGIGIAGLGLVRRRHRRG
ncbi:MAG TPA: PEP-CTERM sorting domain-containing protein [Steroidobacteraceae bacterium]|nr:PEP-CTERM sorting domain-containing protein [Steroidobacteraceae bacterium]